MDDSTKKDLVVGAASAGGAAAAVGASAPLAAGLAAAVALVGVAWTAIMNRDTKRSERLFERMASTDEAPDDFVAFLHEKLRDGDEEMLTKLRELIRADLEAASPDAHEPIARVGRAYVRGAFDAWIARGWVRIFSEVTSREVDVLRQLAVAVRKSLGTGDEYQRVHSTAGIPQKPLGVAVVLHEGRIARPATPRGPESLHVWPQPGAVGLAVGEEGKIAGVMSPDASRLFELLQRHGVVSTRVTLASHLRSGDPRQPAVQLTREAALAFVLSFGA